MGRTFLEDPEEDPKEESPWRHAIENYLGFKHELFMAAAQVACSGPAGLNGTLTTAAVSLEAASKKLSVDAAVKLNDSNADSAANLVGAVLVGGEAERTNQGEGDDCTGQIASKGFVGALSSQNERVNLHPSLITPTNFAAMVAEKSVAGELPNGY